MEIDFIIEQDGILYPIEVKKTAMPSKDSCKNFSALKNLGKKTGTGAVLCFYESPIPICEDVLSIPVWKI